MRELGYRLQLGGIDFHEIDEGPTSSEKGCDRACRRIGDGVGLTVDLVFSVRVDSQGAEIGVKQIAELHGILLDFGAQVIR